MSVRTTGMKADGTVFITFERSVLVPMRGHAVDDLLDDKDCLLPNQRLPMAAMSNTQITPTQCRN